MGTPSSFLDGLDPAAREALLAIASPVSFMAGSVLVRHGEPARGAYVLREGKVEAVIRLPGGEDLTVAALGDGDAFGEMALVEAGTCTATVRAVSHVDGWFVAGEDFRALAAQSSAGARAIQHAVTLLLAGKVGALNAQLMACPAPEDRMARAVAAGDPLAGIPRSRRTPFDVSGYLPRLPLFERFGPDEVDALVAAGSYLEVPRGACLFATGGEAVAAYLVVRGAVEIVAARDGRERRVALAGPGQLAGYLGVLRERPHSSAVYAREASLLLEWSAAGFRALYSGDGRASARLRQAVQKSLLVAMGRTNRSLTRLLSQAQLASAGGEQRRLEAALGGQLTAAHVPANGPEPA